MPRPQKTYYEMLGVKPDARHNDIGLAYSRQMATRRRESAAPDLKGETMLREAFAVLSDLDRRAGYDRQLAAARLKPAFGAKQGVLAAITIVLVAGAIYYFTIKRPADLVAQPVGRPVAEIAAAATTAVGEVVLTEGRVKRVAPAAHGTVVEASIAPSVAAAGAPLLDVYGRVIAVATHAAGQARHVAIPSAWTEDARPASVATPAARQAAEPGGEAPATSAKPAPPMPNAPGSLTPERVEKLHKAFRPPPNIPPDQDP